MQYFIISLLCFIHIAPTFCTILNPETRIIGGTSVAEGLYPFAVGIEVQTSNSNFFCGGSLYNKQWIITAGQCVDRATSFTITLGSIYLEKDDSSRVTVATSEFVLHPDYNRQTLENDIGLIKLRIAILYTDYIQPVHGLPSSNLQDKSYLRIIGWGQTSDSSSALSDRLQQAYVTSLTNDECKAYYGNQIVDSMVCVEGNYNQGSCHGDTGSALFQYHGGVTVHVGVASFISGNGCESTDPSGYTRTYPYVEWIRNVTTS